MKVQVVSDLHNEFSSEIGFKKFIPVKADVLILLGDIGCAGSDTDFSAYKDFLTSLLPYYLHIIIITGNHEYYCYENPSKKDNTLKYIDKKIEKFCSANSKFHFLKNKVLFLKLKKKSYYFIGTTLWSWIDPIERKRIQQNMQDYRYIYQYKNKQIEKYNTDTMCKLHKKNLKFINKSLKLAPKNTEIILLTHHKPYLSKTHSIKTLDQAYESNVLPNFPQINYAFYGHTHVYDNSTLGKTKIYSNPKGYPRQKTGYHEGEILTL